MKATVRSRISCGPTSRVRLGARAVRTAVVHLALIPLLLLGASDARAEDLFEITEFASEGCSVAAEFAELNGDGCIDLFVVALIGIPPEERRAPPGLQGSPRPSGLAKTRLNGRVAHRVPVRPGQR